MHTRFDSLGRRYLLMVAAPIAVLALQNAPSAAETPPTLAWVNQIGAPGYPLGNTGYDWGFGVGADALGNVFVAGNVEGAVGGIYRGGWDLFLGKYAPNGTALWQTQLGTYNHDVGNGFASDSTGNVWIAGQTFGPLGGSNSGGLDAFVVKYAPNGAVAWAAQWGTTVDDQAYAVTTDASGNVLVVGGTMGAIGNPNAGRHDAFLTKFGPAGSRLWSVQIGTPGREIASAVGVDGAGNIYAAGFTTDAIAGPSFGQEDVFLVKYDPSGHELWRRQFGSDGSDFVHDMVVDSAGNFYITGETFGRIADPVRAGPDCYLAKFCPDGTEQWRRQFGTEQSDMTQSIALDMDGDILVGGSTYGSFGGPNANYGQRDDAFLAKFTTHGDFLWAAQVGTSDGDTAEDLAVDGFGNTYLTGQTFGQLGSANAGNGDIFLVKFTNVPEPTCLIWLVAAIPFLCGRRRGPRSVA